MLGHHRLLRVLVRELIGLGREQDHEFCSSVSWGVIVH